MNKELADQIYPLLKASFIDHGDTLEIIKPESWSIEADKVVGIFSQYLSREHSKLVEDIVLKNGKGLFTIIRQKVPPFAVFFTISGAISPEDFLNVLLQGPVKDYYYDFIPEEKFVETLYAFYRQHKQHQEGK